MNFSFVSAGQQHKHENGYVHENFKASNTFSNGGETWMEVCIRFVVLKCSH